MVQKMSEDVNRNRLITDDVCEALKEGQTPIVLTGLTAHVETLTKALAPHCKHVVTLVGSEPAKEKHRRMEYLQRLDTLFLALPVSWKGIVAQYAGRLHREYTGKKEVRIYDYIDIRMPMCDVMYRRRLKGYASVGYRIKQEKPVYVSAESLQGIIFNGHTYQKLFLNDLSQAKHSVVISATRLWLSKHSPILDMLKELSARGVEVFVLVKNKTEKEEKLKETGIRTRVIDSLSMDAVVIDKSLLWYGSVNYLGYNTDENNAIRISDSKVADQILEVLYT